MYPLYDNPTMSSSVVRAATHSGLVVPGGGRGGGGDGEGGGGGARPSATQVSSLTTGQFVTTGLMSEVPIGLMTGGAGSGTRHKHVSSSEHGPLNESGASMSAGLQSQVVQTPHSGCG